MTYSLLLVTMALAFFVPFGLWFFVPICSRNWLWHSVASAVLVPVFLFVALRIGHASGLDLTPSKIDTFWDLALSSSIVWVLMISSVVYGLHGLSAKR